MTKPSDTFLVYPQDGYEAAGKAKFDPDNVVAVKFLTMDGRKIVDPNPGGSSGQGVYEGSAPTGRLIKQAGLKIEQIFVVRASLNSGDAVSEACKVKTALELGELSVPQAGFLSVR